MVKELNLPRFMTKQEEYHHNIIGIVVGKVDNINDCIYVHKSVDVKVVRKNRGRQKDSHV